MLNKFKNLNNKFNQKNLNCLYSLKRKKSSFEMFDVKKNKKFLNKDLNNDIFYRNNKYRSYNKLKMDPLKDSYYVLYIRSSLRGFHINVSDNNGRVLKMFSAGKLGYKKAQRYNQVSLLALGEEVLSFFKTLGPKFKVNIVLKGFSSKRNRIVKFFIRSFLKRSIISIIDLSDLPYNGCRPKKLRRK